MITCLHVFVCASVLFSHQCSMVSCIVSTSCSLYATDQKEKKRIENLFSKVLVKSSFPLNNGDEVAGRQASETSALQSRCTVSIQ